MARFIGVDFSGGIAPWQPEVSRSTVWLATIDRKSEGLFLSGLMPVKDIPGPGRPFVKLARLLAEARYDAAAIDAPFSLPAAHLPPGGHAELLREVRSLPNGTRRDFPEGAALVKLGEKYSVKTKPKPLRETEEYWAKQGLNVRSAMWAGPRGGAPFAAACLRLLEMVGQPIWPWSEAQTGLLTEAFPAAQLHQWGLPHQRYSKGTQLDNRKKILAAIKQRLGVGTVFEETMLDSADALDSVIAAFAAIFVARAGGLKFGQLSQEGQIAVER